MNRLDLIPETELMGAVLLIFILFLGLMALQSIWLVLTVRGLRNSEKRLDEATRQHRNLTQLKKTEELMAFLNGLTPPVSPNTLFSNQPKTPSNPPVADDAAWNGKDMEEGKES